MTDWQDIQDPVERKKARTQAWRDNNKGYTKQWRAKNPEYDKQWRRDNAEKVKDSQARWWKLNPEYMNERNATNIQARLAGCLRSRLYQAIKLKSKEGSAVSDLGCSIEEFKLYIEAQFAVGMSWNNYGEWHLDHIRPLTTFDLTDRNQFLIACHFTNYQPLWEVDNLKKGAIYIP